MCWQTPFLIYGAVVAIITYIARRLKAPVWLAVSIPNIPMGLFLIYSLTANKWAVGEGGAAPYWMLFGPLFAFGMLASFFIIYAIKQINDKSA